MRLIDADALIECIKDDLYEKSDMWYKLIADALIKCVENQNEIKIPEKDKLKNDYACLGTVLELAFPYDEYNEYLERCAIEMRIDDVQRAIIQAMKDIEAFIMM